jgi:hypothetical protein
MAATGTLCKALQARLKVVEPTNSVVADLTLLTSSDAAFLALASPVSLAFVEAWPEGTPLDADGMACRCVGARGR